jgi:hypothetical protein
MRTCSPKTDRDERKRERSSWSEKVANSFWTFPTFFAILSIFWLAGEPHKVPKSGLKTGSNLDPYPPSLVAGWPLPPLNLSPNPCMLNDPNRYFLQPNQMFNVQKKQPLMISWNQEYTAWSRIPKTLHFCSLLRITNVTEETLVPYWRGRLGDFSRHIMIWIFDTLFLTKFEH